MDTDKVLCTECDWTGKETDIDRVPDPKSDEVWNVCPRCRAPEHIVCACDEPLCWKRVTCGWRSTDGYRSTCGIHYRPETKD